MIFTSSYCITEPSIFSGDAVSEVDMQPDQGNSNDSMDFILSRVL